MNNLCVFIISVLLSALQLQGQSYRPFFAGGRHSYFTASDVQSVVLTPDSSNPGSVFQLNRTIELSDSILFSFGQQYLLDQEGPFGDQMEMLPNGVYLFCSDAQDSIFIHTQAALNTPWTFLSDSNLTAQITSKTYGDVNGVTDSLIYISISDGEQIVIGKEKGLLFSPNFSAYFLGESQMEFMAYEDPRKTVVETFFDFPLNARFSYFSDNNGLSYDQQHFKVIARQFLNDGSFASYTLDHIRINYTQSVTNPPLRDTVVWNFSSAGFQFLSKGSLAAAPIPGVSAVGDTGIVLGGFSAPYGGKPRFDTHNYTIDPAGFLYRDPSRLDFESEHYVVGLGRTRSSYNSFNAKYYSTQSLIAWNIGTDSSGSFPDSLFLPLITLDPNSTSDISILVGPVPVRDHINLTLSTTQTALLDISVYNSSGMRVLNRTFSSSSSSSSKLEIPTTGLVPGIYLLELISAGDNRITKKILIE